MLFAFLISTLLLVLGYNVLDSCLFSFKYARVYKDFHDAHRHTVTHSHSHKNSWYTLLACLHMYTLTHTYTYFHGCTLFGPRASLFRGENNNMIALAPLSNASCLSLYLSSFHCHPHSSGDTVILVCTHTHTRIHTHTHSGAISRFAVWIH